MIILLLIFIGLFACRIPKTRVRNFIYSSIFIYILLHLYDYLTYDDSVKCRLNVNPNSSIVMWTEGPIMTDFDDNTNNICSKISVSDDNGSIFYYVNTVKEKIYYRYIIDDITTSNIFTKNIIKHDDDDMIVVKYETIDSQVNELAPSSMPIEEDEEEEEEAPSSMPQELKSSLANVTNEKIEKRTIRRIKPVISLEPVAEERSEDLYDEEDYINNIHNSKNIDMKQYSKPVEAILDDRVMSKHMIKGIVYENDPDLYYKLKKYI